jgi:hypothetical protein
MMHEYDLNIRKMIKPMKVALQHPGKALPFILQVVRHGSGPSLKYTYNKMLETKTGGEMAYKNEEISQYLPSLFRATRRIRRPRNLQLFWSSSRERTKSKSKNKD